MVTPPSHIFFFFNDTATTEIYTLSLHDALPISAWASNGPLKIAPCTTFSPTLPRSEEHTSELQSQSNLVCRLLLEKKKIHQSRRRPVTRERILPVSRHSACRCHTQCLPCCKSTS